MNEPVERDPPAPSSKRGPLPPRRRWRWPRGWGWTIAAITVTTLVLTFYVFHALFLKRIILDAQDDVFLEWTSLSSWWPGRAHVRNFRMRFREPDIDVFVALDEADVDVDVFALFKKTFRANRIRGRGLVMRIRPRYFEAGDPKGSAGPRPEGLPDVPGLPEAPRPPEQGPEPDVPDDRYDKWTVDLRDVDVSGVHEVWIERFRILDATKVSGAFYVRPKRLITLAPTRVELAVADPARHSAGTRLHVAGRRVLESMTGSVTLSIDGHDPRKGEVIGSLSGRTDLRGTIEDLHVLHAVLPPWSTEQLILEGGAGNVAVQLGLDRGRLAKGGKAEVQLGDAAVTMTQGLRAPGSGHAEASAPAVAALASTRVKLESARLEVADADEDTRVRLAMTSVQATHLGHPGSVDMPQLAVEARLQQIDTNRPTVISYGVVSVDAPSTVVTDVRLIESYLPRPTTMRLLAGSVRLRTRADVELRAKGDALIPTGQATVVADADRLRLRLLDSAKPSEDRRSSTLDFEGKLHSEFDLRGASLAGAQSVKGTVSLSDVRIRPTESAEPTRAEPWWAKVQVTSGQLVASDRELPLRMEVSAQVRDVRPMLDVFAIRGDVPSWVSDVVGLEGLTVGARLSAGVTAVDLPNLSARSGAWTIAGRLWHRRGNTKAIAKIGMGPLAVGLQTDGDHTGIQLLGVDGWFAAGQPRF